MGRPRKRPHAEVAGPSDPVVADAEVPMDVDFPFLDPTAQGLEFLDILGAENAFSEPIHVQSQKLPPQSKGVFAGSWHYDLQEIDFDTTNSPPEASQSSAPSTAVSPDAILQDSYSPAGKTHSLSSRSSVAAENATADPPPLGIVNAQNALCGCLASIYLALDSLQQLPKEVGPAMGLARNAAKTAHNTIFCPVCSPEITDPNLRPPVQSYQNLMMLCALLPTIANTYNAILAMIDAEVAKADAENRYLTFNLDEYGGLWGRMAGLDSVCGAAAHFNNAVLEPSMWRRTVRALLKIDVYGVNTHKDDLTSRYCQPCTQIGLRDILELLEARSKTRHEFMDNAVRTGQIKLNDGHCYKILPPGSKHPCQQIIDIARQAIDQLVVA
ncbi:uncharacterized protein E0L32_003714 [Thyridium curvatum]|uniref:Uncharacterized protein n=1 Tax=Thyridium curvatum TaxID=1093900 RepID=A0A507BIK6_9PEZI|nr:uncharacterized protein E0L32_003714 [Thyridium curvatum]TPX16420.1 hypothetical protein E0L32_003714 [Thyridium curvatum]